VRVFDSVCANAIRSLVRSLRTT